MNNSVGSGVIIRGGGALSDVGNRAQWDLLVGPGRAPVRRGAGAKLGLGGWGLCIGELPRCILVSSYIYIMHLGAFSIANAPRPN
jgi:hypothetical protein